MCAVACGAALLPAACGGGHAASRRDVIARADAACASALRSLRGLEAPTSTQAAALAAYLKRARPIVDKEVSALQALPRPSTGRATLERFLAAERQIGRGYAQLSAAAKAGDDAGISRALGALQANPAPRLAAAYGMTQCAGSPATGR